MRFQDPDIESAFWRKHDAAALVLVRIAWCLGICLYIAFALMLDSIVSYGVDTIHTIYLGVAIPVIVAAIISTYFTRLDRWRHLIIAITLLVSTLVVNAPFYFSDPPRDWVHSANILIICFTFAFVASRFSIALGNAAITTIVFEITLLTSPNLDWTYILYSNVYYLSVLCVTATAGLLLEKSHRRNFMQAIELTKAKANSDFNRARSDQLLLNILPAEVAEELKESGAAKARYFEQSTILFSDFNGFTMISQQLSPDRLVDELNTCFKAFDNIITARGIEKIKTIGDAYMCAGGLPDPYAASPADVVHAALEMQAFMKARKSERDAQGLPAFEMRVGIHTGPVVAGIVGVKKFQYDIWGDTVNTASRMESSGQPGHVNISEATYELVKNESGLTFTPRGKVQAKGKGEMEMFFVRRSSEQA
ncbi:MAG: adenylate/guanylate cyclase domain-containing protein [Flavobacteriales bacterium]|nr:adenylate/guanylate cyclase domain-containing protein [Flavobacteriales bacterium]